ncbi:MAG: hypothetical protein L7T24_05770 [Luminiphilus sp.]|nr:hypothetical protein [Luminiphilus sp.]
MLLDVLLASVLSTGLLLGLFELTEQIVQLNNSGVRLSVAAAHLRGIEGHWRLAVFHGATPDLTATLCSGTAPDLLAWCEDWHALLADWEASGSVALRRVSGQYIATLRIDLTSGLEPGSYRLNHRWAGP